MAVAQAEKQPSDAKDIIKDPIVLEFLDLKRQTAYYERIWKRQLPGSNWQKKTNVKN
jgi:predicted nuclease of restriction endonuclease-like (RecB) superfamily